MIYLVPVFVWSESGARIITHTGVDIILFAISFNELAGQHADQDAAMQGGKWLWTKRRMADHPILSLTTGSIRPQVFCPRQDFTTASDRTWNCYDDMSEHGNRQDFYLQGDFFIREMEILL